MSGRTRTAFPGLRQGEWKETSPADPFYNCIGWALDPAKKRWWWPDPMYQWYWPGGVRRDTSLEAFAEALATVGFERCESDDLEDGVEKVAIFVKTGEVQHAARQLGDGQWTSKLGEWEDIQHLLEAVEGKEYGTVAAVFSRPLATGSTDA